MTAQPILDIQNISKGFGGVQALKGVSFSIQPGEIHAIVGENGAGKSTMMNILAGVHQSDTGQILFNGDPYRPANPREARQRGISIVFQELALFPTLPVYANLFVGQEQMTGPRLDHQAMLRIATDTIREMGVDLDPQETVNNLSLGQQQWVEIARALSDDARVLILDEPNSALNQHETKALFRLLESLKRSGITILYISHRLEEVFQIADRVTVLRDGQYVNTWSTAGTSISEIVANMVGRSGETLYERASTRRDELVLQVRDLAIKGRLAPTSLDVHEGEVVGLVGLEGSGFSDLLQALFGVRTKDSGSVELAHEQATVRTPHEALEHDIAMVPADRRGLGLFMNWSVQDNLIVSILSRLSRFGVLNYPRAEDTTRQYIDRLRIVTDSPNKGVVYLSGGNQQKVLLARWLATQPRLLILDDPTRGIDIGAKREIYGLIDQIAAEGVGVLLTSSEIEETLALSDRILVFRQGRIIAELSGDDITKELVTEFMAGDVRAARERLASMRAEPLSQVPEATATTAAHAAESAADAPRKEGRFGRILRQLFAVREVGVALSLIVVILVFALLTPYFFTSSNLLLITRQMAILGVITVGMTFVLASGEVDLSVGWIFNASMSAVAILSVNHNIDPWLLIPVGVLVGAALGTLNGLLAVVLELPTIIITLGTLTLYRGIALAINGERTVGNLPESSFFELGSGSVASIPNLTIIMLIIFAVAAWILRNTQFARHLLAMGANRPAAMRVGIRTPMRRIQVMAFSGMMCGLAGVMGLAFLGAADPQSGTGWELTAIAAAIIGGAQLGGGAGTVWGSLIGIALIMSIQNGLVLMELRPGWRIAATGLVIIAAVTIDYLTRARRRRSAQRISSSLVDQQA